MKVSETVDINSNIFRYSYCGSYFAYGFQNKLFVKTTMRYDDTVSLFTCSDIIEYIEWSTNSKYIMCAIFSRSSIEIFSIHDNSWICKIQEGIAGLQSCTWGPRQYHILSFADFNAKLSIWSLTSRSVAYIDNFILKKHDHLSFSETGDCLALVTGNIENYKISLFSTTSWTKKEDLECSGDIVIPCSPIWSPDGNYIVIWETIEILYGYIQIFSVNSNTCVKSFKIKDKFSGVKSAKWSPSSQFLAVGCYNGKVYILNYLTWSTIKEFVHDDVLSNKECKVFQEINYHDPDIDNEVKDFESMLDRPITFTSKKPNSDKCLGIGDLAFSSCGSYLVTKCDKMPALIWLWEMKTLTLKAVLIHKNEVSHFVWDFNTPRLLISSISSGVTMWDISHQPLFIQLPKEDCNNRVMLIKSFWRPHNECYSNLFCCCSNSRAYIFDDSP